MPTVEELLAARSEARFTPTERRIVTLLADGFGHRREELLALLDDDLASVIAARMHVSNIRKKLPRNVGIICEYKDKRFWYRLVHFVGGAGE